MLSFSSPTSIDLNSSFGDDLEVQLYGFIHDRNYRLLHVNEVAALYRQVGWTCFESLRGEFSLVIIDRQRLEVLLVRDPLGVKPLFYRADDRQVVVGLSARAVCKEVCDLSIDEKFLQSLERDQFEDFEGTPFTQIKRVAPGSAVIYKDGRVRVQRYFQLHASSKVKMNDAVEAFEDLFCKSLKVRHEYKKGIGCFLSGGLDSSLITLVAQENFPIKSYCIDVSDAEALEPVPLNAVLSRLQLPAQRIDPDKRAIEVSLSYFFETEDIFYDPTLFMFAPALRDHASSGGELMFTGLGGDDIYSLDCFYLWDLIVDQRWKEALSECAYHRQESKSWFHLAYAALLKPWLSGSRWKGELGGAYNLRKRLTCQSGLAMTMETEQGFAALFGLEMSYPLLDLGLIELATVLPAEMLTWGGRDKIILREAFQKLIPIEVAKNRSQQNYHNYRARQLGLQGDRFSQRDVDGVLKQLYFKRIRQLPRNTIVP